MPSLPGKMESWLWETKSCGSGGCSSSLKVLFLESDASVDQCPEKGITPVERQYEKVEAINSESAVPDKGSVKSEEPVASSREVTCQQFSTMFGNASDFTDLQKKIIFEKVINKDVDWVGEVVDVRLFLGSVIVSVKFADATLVSDVDVYVKKSEGEKAANLRKGVEVRFRGRLTEWGEISNHTVQDATIVEM
ncbi:hypothetical protein Psta_0292 [Pirellula staleyi DSM 6068]|uniref:Uncharacterized protein n=1 Tax=Pirellula staleyi (strain ATCC 27377 / DSM 6068 / ICPB 4128) TaxID=530564 RepID=D2R274_PIRSD|nr:hypothetical protein [Pirellula staleyi]ADB14983.1 hypothetical protein Psta_0292 [Pirellula staleyi DSM 6068]